MRNFKQLQVSAIENVPVWKGGDWLCMCRFLGQLIISKSILKWRNIQVTKGEGMCYVIQQWKELICAVQGAKRLWIQEESCSNSYSKLVLTYILCIETLLENQSFLYNMQDQAFEMIITG